MESATIEQPARIRSMIEAVSYAASHDSTRYNLNAVRLESDAGDTLAIATDGHRLAIHREEGLTLPIHERGFSVPLKSIADLRKTMARPNRLNGKTADIAVTSNSMEVVIAGRPSASIPEVDSDFPNWRQVVPESTPHRYTLTDPAGVAAALAVFERVAMTNANAVKVTCNGETMALECDYSDDGVDVKATASFPVTTATDVPMEVSFGVNARYFGDAIRQAVGTVTLGFTDEFSPIRFDDAGGLSSVVMPMRLK